MKRHLKKFIYPIVLAIIIWSVLFFARIGADYYALEAFWLTGIFLILQSLLFWVSSEGVFNTITWGFGRLFDSFRSRPKYNMKYFEFVELKKEKKKVSPWPSLIIGGLFFIIGLVWWLIIS